MEHGNVSPAPVDSFMQSFIAHRDDPKNAGVSTYPDFLNLSPENRMAGLDRAVASRERGHLVVGKLTLMGQLQKVGDSFRMVNVERFLDRSENQNQQQWTQQPYPGTIEFNPEEVKFLKTKFSGFYLEKAA
ncbi:MAG TPA: hypothetical protein VGO21_02245 [Candidatus Paceibacterota bacterium]|jgi:hypothetical protein|nr:hypothetical protein [Candidatus Paceibacterota bacterium]